MERKRNMVADDIIGALGMENETIEGAIDKVAVKTVVVVVMNTFTMCQLYNISRPRRVGRPNQE